ncbi:MAG: CYTH domain-containing protein [Bacteroidetes bacterium]|nr:CYTH domain-containing protein [Bacteroidota bacterium]
MPQEIEHKYLIRKDFWYAIRKPEGKMIRQGYLAGGSENTIRVRIAGPEAFLTIKGPSVNAVRQEYEYPIPVRDANEILDLFTQKIIEKIRYRINFEGKTWEVDEFFGANDGLILAEIELRSLDETYEKPAWLGEEVTHDPRYYNSYLAEHPFSSW